MVSNRFNSLNVFLGNKDENHQQTYNRICEHILCLILVGHHNQIISEWRSGQTNIQIIREYSIESIESTISHAKYTIVAKFYK